MKARDIRQAGFTLVELMVVVAIIGILATIALPQLTNYMKNAETTEPSERLGEIAKNLQGYIDTRPTVATTVFVATDANGLKSKILHPTTGSSLTDMIPTLVLPASSKWIYSVDNIAVDSTTRIATLCLSAYPLDPGNKTKGAVFYSSTKQTAAGWDGNFHRVQYIKGTSATTPTECTV